MQAIRSNPSVQPVWLIPGFILPEVDWKTQRDLCPLPQRPLVLKKTKNLVSPKKQFQENIKAQGHKGPSAPSAKPTPPASPQPSVSNATEKHTKPKAFTWQKKPRISILFDGDNISSKVIPGLIQKAKEHGEIVHFKIFLRQNLRDCKTWQDAIKKFSLHTVCPQGEMRKNDTDECMASAAKQIIRKKAKKKIDVMCLVSNDHYFAKVMQDAKAAGKTVWSVGSKKTSLKLKAQCDEMIYVEPLLKMA